MQFWEVAEAAASTSHRNSIVRQQRWRSASVSVPQTESSAQTFLPPPRSFSQWNECWGREFPNGSSFVGLLVPDVVPGRSIAPNRPRRPRSQTGGCLPTGIAQSPSRPGIANVLPRLPVSERVVNRSIVPTGRYLCVCGKSSAAFGRTTRSARKTRANADAVPNANTAATGARAQAPDRP